jgi:hypothetical protein
MMERKKDDTEKTISQQPQKPHETGEKKIAVNKNPAANENVSAEKSEETSNGAGSEITDGEGG